MVLTLTEKYRPKSVKNVIGSKNKQSIDKFVSWLRQWLSGKVPSKRAVFLYGPAGVGKTSLVYAAAKDFKLELLELNASDKRDKETIEHFITNASNVNTLFGTQLKLVLIDEIEGLTGTEDRGGLSAITKMIKESRVPIVLIANDVWAPKFSSLRSLCMVIEFKKLNKNEIVTVLRNICISEGILADPEALKKIAELADGDLRAAINDLQFLITGKKSLKMDDVLILPKRNREIKIFETLNNIFRAKSVRDAYDAVSNSEVDYGMLLRWLSENIPNFMKDPIEYYSALDKLSKATIFLKRARITNNWRLLVYTFSLMSAGVAFSRKSDIRGFIKSAFPRWVKTQSIMKQNRAIRDELAQKIANKLHISRIYALNEALPYISVLLEHPRMSKKVIDYFELSDKHVSFIKKRFS